MVTRGIIAGIGCRKGTDLAALSLALDGALAAHGRTRADLSALASWSGKAGEQGLQALAEQSGLSLLLLDGDALRSQPVTAPSRAAQAHLGLPSVAEAAALAAAGPNAKLLGPRHVGAGVVVALVMVDQGPSKPVLLSEPHP